MYFMLMVCIIQKKDSVECIALFLLMIWSDAICTWQTATELSEHYISLIRVMIFEFTINKLISIVKRGDRIWSVMFLGNLSSICFPKKKGGYAETFDIKGTNNEVKFGKWTCSCWDIYIQNWAVKNGRQELVVCINYLEIMLPSFE